MHRSRSTSPSTFILDGGQVFCSGLAEIGLGTQGLGAQDTSAQRERDDAFLRAYYEERDAKVREQMAREHARLAKISKDQALSPRKRLEQVMEAREEEIARMTRERKAFEAAFKEKQIQQAAEKNARIHAEKEAIQKQLAEAKLRREKQRESEKKAIRAERAEALAMLRQEEEEQKRALQEHHTQLRHWHEVCKARAAEEAKQRLIEKEMAVKEQNAVHQAKKENIQKIVETIVTLKSDLIKSVKEELKAGRVVFDKREDMLAENAKTIKQDIKTRDAEKKAAIEAARAEKKRAAELAKEEAAKRQEEYFKMKADQRRVLSEQAKLQRMQAKLSIHEEREAVKQERQERFEFNKAAIQRSKSATPSH